MMSLAGIAVAAFASTNVDDLLILIAFFAAARLRPSSIVAGQLAGMAALILASLIGSFVALAIPGAWIGFLGLLPIALGIRQLLRQRADGRPGSAAEPSAGGFVAVTLAVIASGGDNISLYVPLFSVHSGPEVMVFGASFMALSTLWCMIARTLAHSRDRAVQRWLERQAWNGAIIPSVMIALGLYILIKTDALTGLFGSMVG